MIPRGQKRPRSVSVGPISADTRQRDNEWKRNKRNPSSFKEQTNASPPTDVQSHSESAPGSCLWKVGEFRVTQLLSHNKLTMVCKAEHRDTGEVVVTKTVYKDSNRKCFKALKLLRKEALVLSSLQGHPRILPLLQVIEDDDRLCLVMKYAEGGDLFEYIRARGSLSREDAYRIFGQIVEGLSYAHSRGFIHRDIKPGNEDAEGRCGVHRLTFLLFHREHIRRQAGQHAHRRLGFCDAMVCL